MLLNISLKGHKLHVYDVSGAACTALQNKGANVCKTQQEIAKKSDFVVTMLPNNDIVAKTYEIMTQDGVNSHTIFIDSSTIDPNVAKSVSVTTFDIRYKFLLKFIQKNKFIYLGSKNDKIKRCTIC